MNKRDSLMDLLSIQDRISRLFDDTLVTENSGVITTGGTWSPVVDIYETEIEFVVKAEVPEVRQSDIDIRVIDNTLMIKGERKPLRTVMEGYYRIERAYGKFQRSFLLPGSVEQDNIKATLMDGVLNIVLSKKEKVVSRQAEINET